MAILLISLFVKNLINLKLSIPIKTSVGFNITELVDALPNI